MILPSQPQIRPRVAGLAGIEIPLPSAWILECNSRASSERRISITVCCLGCSVHEVLHKVQEHLHDTKAPENDQKKITELCDKFEQVMKHQLSLQM